LISIRTTAPDRIKNGAAGSRARLGRARLGDCRNQEPSMSDPLAGWHSEHARFSHLLDLLDVQVEAFHRGEQPNYELMRDIVYYLRSYADEVHHAREDVAFARLVKRSHSMSCVVQRLLQEHRVITVAGEEFLQRLEEATGDMMAPRASLEAAAAIFLVYYRHHIAKEEREVLPQAAALLTPEDWAAVIAAIPAQADPLFGDDVNERFEQLRRQIDREAATSVSGLR
jgi:hemerythrin-like domain-containing protein